jgi:hypothetical protein
VTIKPIFWTSNSESSPLLKGSVPQSPEQLSPFVIKTSTPTRTQASITKVATNLFQTPKREKFTSMDGLFTPKRGINRRYKEASKMVGSDDFACSKGALLSLLDEEESDSKLSTSKELCKQKKESSTLTSPATSLAQKEILKSAKENIDPESQEIEFRQRTRTPDRDRSRDHHIRLHHRKTDRKIDHKIRENDSPLLAKGLQTTVFSNAQILQIRFSQKAIDDHIGDGTKLEELLEGGWDPERGIIEIVKMPDGLYTSLDNRRLWVLKNMEMAETQSKVIIHNYNDPATSDKIGQVMSRISLMRSPDRKVINSELEDIIAKEQQIKKDTYGYLILARMHGLDRAEKQFLRPKSLIKSDDEEVLFGFTELPTVMNAKVKQQRFISSMMRSKL